jgi:hypothetical protein
MGDSLVVKVGLTMMIVVFMVPGLIVEPGPLSEVVGLGAIATVWGFDELLGGGS